eukprot:5447204-Pleurochrysis_carterae.AAC.2
MALQRLLRSFQVLSLQRLQNRTYLAVRTAPQRPPDPVATAMRLQYTQYHPSDSMTSIPVPRCCPRARSLETARYYEQRCRDCVAY